MFFRSLLILATIGALFQGAIVFAISDNPPSLLETLWFFPVAVLFNSGWLVAFGVRPD